MNLQTSIRPDLWLSISNSYLKENYSHAILDAMHHLSNVLRDKTGVDGDGAALVGQALGGNPPRLKINKLQTETERNVQRGIEQILRGLYWAVRNPRSHEQIEDTKDTADAIVYFISYLLDIIAQSEEPFTLPRFLERIFDPDFVSSSRYAELLVTDIPANKCLDTLIEIYLRRSEGDGLKLEYVVSAILARLNEEQVAQFLKVVSEELMGARDDAPVRTTLQVLPPGLWPGLREASRLRIEYKLLRSIKEGEAYSDSTGVRGALGTWGRDFLPYFSNKDEVTRVIVEKLEDSDTDDRRFIVRYFLGVLPLVVLDNWNARRCINAICLAIRNEETEAIEGIKEFIHGYPERWQKTIVASLSDLTDPDSPAVYLSDGTPFLKSEEDIPF